jgi:hypothetical protein
MSLQLGERVVFRLKRVLVSGATETVVGLGSSLFEDKLLAINQRIQGVSNMSHNTTQLVRADDDSYSSRDSN